MNLLLFQVTQFQLFGLKMVIVQSLGIIRLEDSQKMRMEINYSLHLELQNLNLNNLSQLIRLILLKRQTQKLLEKSQVLILLTQQILAKLMNLLQLILVHKEVTQKRMVMQ